MINLVYFGASISKEVGDPLPCMSLDPNPQWITQSNLVEALNAGSAVTIRPATFVEYLQVESLMALDKIEQGVCEQLSQAEQCQYAPGATESPSASGPKNVQ